ncbi:hypothetical protein G647_03602 [Cladophialophora carrionii CBS 160.54]|uniref:KANL3/Tex30 alpha/beta hydrolase-like domain-containing protein n=1 Tax=Cladophialophora carrionii CBS 160.54 TaxID=1279043 RepID=V9DD38_9EURO|nr:uncharacterized protein G647_03602 [Cladophialophora carrionii CBS 160.54]ETI24233.1 hypothetical protein G647_03602 [Cladophialophora carrionii CBS 160.54]
MAPRKRKVEATTVNNAESTVDDKAPLRRSSRRKAAVQASDKQQGKETTTPAVDEDDDKKKSSTGPASSDTALDAEALLAEPENAPTSMLMLNSDHPSREFTSFTIPASNKAANALSCLRSPVRHPRCLIFTHGAGGDLSAAAMVHFSEGFASSLGEGAGLVMFPGNMNVKARAATFDRVKQHELGEEYMKTAATRQEVYFAYGGRSMGARAAVMASHVDEDVKMLVLVSYPLVGPSGDVRDKILLDTRPDVDVLFISGDHDSMCDMDLLDEVRGKMKARTWIVRVKGADHGMNLRGGKKLKEGTKAVGGMTGKLAAGWLQERDQERKEMDLSWDGEHSDVVSSGWLASARKGQREEKGKDIIEEQSSKTGDGSGNPKRRKVKM